MQADAAALSKRLQMFLRQAGLANDSGMAGATPAQGEKEVAVEDDLPTCGGRGGKGNRGGRRGGAGRGAASAAGSQACNSAILH